MGKEIEKLSIGKNAMRKFALLLLDSDDGINLKAYETLSVMLVETGNDDILDAVDITEDRAYIGEDYAEAELAIINEETKCVKE
jgi:hypothetical protein